MNNHVLNNVLALITEALGAAYDVLLAARQAVSERIIIDGQVLSAAIDASANQNG
jgi:hypothetical protein